jgi:hypothetical protein
MSKFGRLHHRRGLRGWKSSWGCANRRACLKIHTFSSPLRVRPLTAPAIDVFGLPCLQFDTRSLCCGLTLMGWTGTRSIPQLGVESDVCPHFFVPQTRPSFVRFPSASETIWRVRCCGSVVAAATFPPPKSYSSQRIGRQLGRMETPWPRPRAYLTDIFFLWAFLVLNAFRHH